MRIQEMRSGSVHLKKKMPAEDRQDFFEHRDAREVILDDDVAAGVDISCDLDEPQWSVVSFSQVEAGGLTHTQAAKLLLELDAAGVPGLCIVTDNAARKAILS